MGDAELESPVETPCGDSRDARLGSLMSKLSPRGQQFRLRYVRVEGRRGAEVVQEIELHALDASEAIRASTSLPWPRGAAALRILDREGHEIFERLKADWR